MAFYQCVKCNLTWQYPINVCPHCFEKITQAETKTAKVIAVSRVTIPTLFHPIVPYFILLLQDELGNVWGHKSQKEYEIGSEFKTATISDRDAVAVWRVKYNVLEALKKVTELLNVKLDKSAKVLVLPTAGAPSHYYFRDNTGPDFFEAVLNLLAESGVLPENITVGAQSFDEVPVGAIAQKSGLLKICQKYKITPTDLATEPFEKRGKYEIAKNALDADLILNLAMLKIGQASATHNLFRVLKKENYLALQYLESDSRITTAFKELDDKVLTLADAENTQRPNKLTTFTDLVLAGRNPLNLDRVFNEAVMAVKMPEILAEINIENIPIAGRSLEEIKYQAEVY